MPYGCFIFFDNRLTFLSPFRLGSDRHRLAPVAKLNFIMAPKRRRRSARKTKRTFFIPQSFPESVQNHMHFLDQ